MLSSPIILLALCLLLPMSVSARTSAPESRTADGTGAGCQNGQETAGEIWFNVSRVVDGDTFWVDDGSEKGLKVRLIGIDAPEPRNVKHQQTFTELAAKARRQNRGLWKGDPSAK